MNETIIRNINNTVSEKDRLFIAGDVVINKKFIPLMAEIKCENRINIMGNHCSPVVEELKTLLQEDGRLFRIWEYNHNSYPCSHFSSRLSFQKEYSWSFTWKQDNDY
jgi:calcineurin-like phosphoesterase family protein